VRRVVHQDVHAAKPVERAAHDFLGNARRGDITGYGERAVAEGLCQGFGATRVADVDRDRCPALVEALGGRAPEPARGARDDGDASGEVRWRDGRRDGAVLEGDARI